MKGLLKRLFGEREPFEGGGLILFETTHDAMKAEKLLCEENIKIRLVAPPLSKRTGCDLGIEFNIMDRVLIDRIIRARKISHIAVDELEEDSSRVLELVDLTDYGEFIMFKAGNMKLTVNTETKTIVNVSGGGCPDIPYLNIELVGKKIKDAKRPRDLGFTLCALMLDKAFTKCCELMGEE